VAGRPSQGWGTALGRGCGRGGCYDVAFAPGAVMTTASGAAGGGVSVPRAALPSLSVRVYIPQFTVGYDSRSLPGMSGFCNGVLIGRGGVFDVELPAVGVWLWRKARPDPDSG
jgi:hypothetical protein